MAAGAVGDDRPRRKLGRRHRLRRQDQGRAAQPDHLHLAKRFGGNSVRHVGARHHGNLQSALTEHVMEDFAGVDGELDGQTGIGARCAIEQRRQPGHCRDPRRAQAHVAGQRFLRADALTDFRGERHHLRGVVRQFVTLGGQSDLSRGTIEQRDAEFLLQFANARRDGGLGGLKMARGGVEAAEPRDPVQRFELPEVHGRNYSCAAGSAHGPARRRRR